MKGKDRFEWGGREDDIQINLKHTGWEGVDRFHLAQNRYR
jgi:hypothetical protein